MGQKQLVFFESGASGPVKQERERDVSRHNTECPLNGCGVSESVLLPLRAIAAIALGERNHCCPFVFVLHGHDQAARRLVHSYAATIGLPYVGCTGQRIKTANDLLVRIASVCESTTFHCPGGTGTLALTPVVQEDRPDRFGGNEFLVVPPLVVLFRHVEYLNADMLHRLRLACDRSDPVLYGSDWPADTARVSWFLHADDPADLPDELEEFPSLGTLR